MGPKTGHVEQEQRIAGSPKDLSPVMVWLGLQLNNHGKFANEIEADFPPLKGWKIDIMSVLSDKELTNVLQPGIVPLSPGNRETRKQLTQWEQELGGEPILFLLVPDHRPWSEMPGHTPWLAQPVTREWLTTLPIDSLVDQYETMKDKLEGQRLRAAIIARTGYRPEMLP